MIETTTNGQRLLIVPVYIASTDFFIHDRVLYYKQNQFRTYNEEIPLGDYKDYKILGTLHVENHQPVLSEGFDPEPLVEKRNIGPEESHPIYQYRHDPNGEWFESPFNCIADLITSAITKAGYSWGNPLGEEPNKHDGDYWEITPVGGDRYLPEIYLKDLAAWRAAESKAIHKVAVIKINNQ